MRRRLKDFATKTAGGLLRPWFGGVGCILSLHRVIPSDERSPLWLNRSLEITPGALRAILDWVRRRGFDVIRLDELRNRLGEPRGPKFVCFTFDDGYRDNMTHALPIFQDFGYPFAVNITTGLTDHTTSTWWYLVEDVLALRSSLSLEWGGTPYSWQWNGPDDREYVFGQIATLIRKQDKMTRDTLIEVIAQAAGLDPLARTRELIMNWDQVRTLAADWHVTIGAHTLTHQVLSNLSDADLRAEIVEGRKLLESRLQKRIQHFAYPFGGPDAVGKREFDAAIDADFETAVTTRTGNLFKEHAWNLLALPRLTIDGNYPALHLLQKLEAGLIPASGNGWKRVVTD